MESGTGQFGLGVFGGGAASAPGLRAAWPKRTLPCGGAAGRLSWPRAEGAWCARRREGRCRSRAPSRRIAFL